MINLSNETDYKLIFKTKNLYNFFFVLIITLFVGVFLKILNLRENKKSLCKISGDKGLLILEIIL